MKSFNQSFYLDKLTDHHRLFYGVFELGNPIYTDEIDTAAVAFNTETGNIDFLINENFFNTLSDDEKLFLICHEALHVVFSHIERTKKFSLNNEYSNIAQDIVINELLINEFGFNREELPFLENACFVDTVFNKTDIKKYSIINNGSFEYYYELLLKINPKVNKVATIDIHDLKDMDDSKYDNIPEEVADSIVRVAASKMSQEDSKELIEKIGSTLSDKVGHAGLSSIGEIYGIQLEKNQKKASWELLVKNKIASLLKVDERELETFSVRPRRLTCLSEDLFLPEYKTNEDLINDKFNIAFFLDASGSCIGYKNQFFSLANSIPKDKFNVVLYSFDTRVYKLNLKDKNIQGGGGTSFEPIETKIQNSIRSDKDYNGKYPDLVFVLTDGYGDRVRPEKPKNWFWLMTDEYTNCLPKDSSYIMLNNFKKGDVKVKTI